LSSLVVAKPGLRRRGSGGGQIAFHLVATDESHVATTVASGPNAALTMDAVNVGKDEPCKRDLLSYANTPDKGNA
jgi:hypothetical protein